MPFSEGKKYLEYSYKAIVENYKIFWYHAFAAFVFVLIKGVDARLKMFGLITIFFSAATIVPGYFFYGHYWIQIVPGLALLSGLTFFSAMNFFRNRLNIKFPKLAYVYLAVFGIMVFVHTRKQKEFYFHPNYDLILRQVYGSNPFPEAMEIAKFINANSTPKDQVVLIGSEPQIYFYTKKNCPSRHAYFTALVNNVPEHKQWQREFVSDVEKAKPRYFVFFNNPISLLVQPNTDSYVFEWANKYINENYTLVGYVDVVEGYLNSVYVWREQIATYKPQGKSNMIYVYERKS